MKLTLNVEVELGTLVAAVEVIQFHNCDSVIHPNCWKVLLNESSRLVKLIKGIEHERTA